jgi:hypothetical protein
MTTVILAAALSLAVVQKPEEKLDNRIAAARGKAIEYLKKQQKANGSWEGDIVTILVDMEGGFTALAALALLEAGVPAKDSAVVKAIEYLMKLEPKKTYVVSLQTQVLARTKNKKHLPQIQKYADWLIEKSVNEDGKLRGWSYPGHQLADNSNTHFAVVALHDAANAGAKIDAKIWGQVRELYARGQIDGGWGYYNDRALSGSRVTHSMTTCALLGLALAAKNDPKAKMPDPAFERGMPALLKLTGGEKSQAYSWLATAELGRALGVSEFKAGKDTRAWYREGAEKLIRDQNPDGSFSGKSGIDTQSIYTTACALYFLGQPAKK